MAFEIQEIVFYVAISVAGCFGGLARLWRDGELLNLRRSTGRCLSSGLFGFGAVGLWVGRTPSDVTGPFYFMAVAAFIGYLSADLQDKIFEVIVTKAMTKLGIELPATPPCELPHERDTAANSTDSQPASDGDAIR